MNLKLEQLQDAVSRLNERIAQWQDKLQVMECYRTLVEVHSDKSKDHYVAKYGGLTIWDSSNFDLDLSGPESIDQWLEIEVSLAAQSLAAAALNFAVVNDLGGTLRTAQIKKLERDQQIFKQAAAELQEQFKNL